MELSAEQTLDYMRKYDEWENSSESQKNLRQFNPNKLAKSPNEVVAEKGMIIDGDRVYLSEFHYKKHQNYLQYIQAREGQGGEISLDNRTKANHYEICFF